jgi:hypothetical protein
LGGIRKRVRRFENGADSGFCDWLQIRKRCDW